MAPNHRPNPFFGLGNQRVVVVLHHEVIGDAQHEAEPDRGVAGNLPKLFAPGLPFLAQPLKRRDGHRQQLDDDAGVDVGGNGQGKNTGVGKAAADISVR